MTTTLITGGAGFIGSHLADFLLARGETVVCLDNFDAYYDPARKRANVAAQLDNASYTLVEGDIRDRELVMRLFEKNRFDRVAHLAALAGPRPSVKDPALYAEVNVTGTINIMDAAHQFETGNFIQASTSSVYGETDKIPFEEDQPTTRPLTPYPATKIACEVMGHAYYNMFGMNFTVVRFFTVYGPRARPDMMAFHVIDSIMHGREITLFEPEKMRRDWTYVDDIISGVVAALDKPMGFEIFNIGRGEPVRLADFVDILEELTGKKAIVKITPAPVSDSHVTYASIEKARRLLGYEPHTSIHDGLARTWEWYRSLQDGQ